MRAGTAAGSPILPRAKATSQRTNPVSSPMASMRADTAAGSPILPRATAALRQRFDWFPDFGYNRPR